MQWSVEEQTIRSTKPVTLNSIVLRVDPSASHMCLMEMHGDSETYDLLRFDRNGAFVSIEAVEPKAPVEPPPEGPTQSPSEVTHHSSSKKK